MIKIKGEEMELRKFMLKHEIKFDNSIGSKLEPGDITLRRLCRVYRFHLTELLKKNTEMSSYLFRKYTDQDEKYRTICFPGAEHLVSTTDEAQYLYDAYKRMDDKSEESGVKTSFTERISRVLLARGVKHNAH